MAVRTDQFVHADKLTNSALIGSRNHEFAQKLFESFYLDLDDACCVRLC